MKIVIKIPTKNRVNLFFPLLDSYYALLSNKHDVQFIINCDQNDFSMRSMLTVERLKTYKNLTYCFAPNKTKIEAINANLDKLPEDFDVLVLSSDDMTPIKQGYDDVIAQTMLENFPDTDGALWFNDGTQSNGLNTLPIMGKKYFQRFGYIYHPSYKSFYADNEYTQVGKSLGKLHYVDSVIIRHDHCTTTKARLRDELYWENEKYWYQDADTFREREAKNFG